MARTLIPIESLPTKPRKGAPCNGCGYCCHEEICSIGRLAWPEAEAPCPGLWKEGNRMWCGLVVLETVNKHEPLFANKLGIARGCCSDEPKDA
jgi:hypothetical protein